MQRKRIQENNTAVTDGILCFNYKLLWNGNAGHDDPKTNGELAWVGILKVAISFPTKAMDHGWIRGSKHQIVNHQPGTLGSPLSVVPLKTSPSKISTKKWWKFHFSRFFWKSAFCLRFLWTSKNSSTKCWDTCFHGSEIRKKPAVHVQNLGNLWDKLPTSTGSQDFFHRIFTTNLTTPRLVTPLRFDNWSASMGSLPHVMGVFEYLKKKHI